MNMHSYGRRALGAALGSLALGLLPGIATAQSLPQRILPTARAVSAEAGRIRTPLMMEAFQRIYDNLQVIQRAAPPPRPTMPEAEYLAAKAAAAAARAVEKVSPRAAVGPLVAPGTITLNRPGPKQTDAGNGFYPPDTNGDISPTQIVFPVNLSFNVYNRSGTKLKSTTINALLGTTDSLSDPRVMWDSLWSRWVLTVIPITAPADLPCVWLAISQTSSATGNFITYKSCIGGGIFAAGDLWDYDQLGLSQDAVLITGNIFGVSSFKGPAVFAVPKARVYNSLGYSVPVFALGTSVGTVAPPVVQDSNSTAFFLATNTARTSLNLYAGTNLENEYQGSFVLKAQIPVSTYSVPPSGRQPGTTEVLDTLDGRFQGPSAQYSNSLWNTHTTALGSFPAPRFYQIDTTANTIVQSGTYFESSTSDDFNPSITANSNGEAFTTWTSTDRTAGTGHNAAVRISGRQAGDTLGSIGAGTTLFTSAANLTGNKQGSVQRWGDYSRTALDPAAPSGCTGRRAAVFNETILNTSTWGTRYGIFGFC